MIKKLIALALSLGLSMGLLGAAPLSAADSGDVALYKISVDGAFQYCL